VFSLNYSHTLLFFAHALRIEEVVSVVVSQRVLFSSKLDA
jgi:hypothetical protein